MNESVERNFPIPGRHAPTPDSPDISPKALESWLSELPMGYPELTAAHIMGLLHQVNRTELADPRHRHFVFEVGDCADNVLRMLHLKLRDVAAPPTGKEMKLAELVIRLHGELALAYVNAAGCKMAQPLFRKKVQPPRAKALRRAMNSLYESLKVHHLINTPPGDGLWRRIYALYTLAQHRELTSTTEPASATGRSATLEDVFKSAILLHVSSPQSLRGDELGVLCELLPELVPHAQLVPTETNTDECGVVMLGIDSGTPPYLDKASDCADCARAGTCLSLDVTALFDQIRRELTQLKKAQPGAGNASGSQKRILEQLKNRLGPKRKRRTKRVKAQQQVEVIAGLQHAHTLLIGGESANTTQDQPPAAKSATPPANGHKITYNVVLNLELVTIETPAHFNAPESTLSSRRPTAAPRKALCKSLNFSSRGYCLAAINAHGFRIKVGELIILRDQDGERWLPAVVCWISSKRHAMHFGVKLLAPHVRAGKALCLKQEETRSTECLLLFKTGAARPSSILMSPRCIKEPTAVTVNFGGNNLEIALNRELSRTHGYVEYSCDNQLSRNLNPETVPLSDSTAQPLDTMGLQDLEFEDDERPWIRFLS